MRYLKLLAAVLTGVLFLSAANLHAQGMTITPYGYLKLDMVYDQAHTNTGNYALNLLPETKADNQLSITARQTRLGVRFAVKSQPAVSGRFESDFYNPSLTAAENKNTIMLRHAYIRVDFAKWYLIAGQTSDVISPLVPTTVDYTVLWDQGNIGFRIPQLQVGNTGSKLQLIGAISRTIANDVDTNKIDDGQDSGVPTVQGSVAWVTARTYLGVSGHYGVMEYKNVKSEKTKYYTDSINLSAKFQPKPALLVQGEAFSGKNIGQFFGGIGQNFDNRLADVKSSGGWANVTVNCAGSRQFTLGGSFDNPDEDAVKAFPTLIYNSDYYANMFCPLAANTQIATEVSYLTTKFFSNFGAKKSISGVRVQLAFIMNF